MLTITPPHRVIGSMPPKVEEITPVLLGIRIEKVGTGFLKLLLDVAFQSIPLERPFGSGFWYFASTGAHIELRASGAKILSHTEGSRIVVKYVLKTENTKSLNAKIEPKVKLLEDAEFSVGAVGTDRTVVHGGETVFISHENPLAVVETQEAVSWQYSMGQGHKAVRDFLFGNLKLWADCKWPGKNRRGRVRLRCSSFFFDEENKRLPRWKAIGAEFLVADGGYKIAHRNGLEVEFRYDDAEGEVA